ncbi:unnamed protein product [Echinostoma caproni]|uniref:Exportin-5 domain-containing protein n=1 Tax=Echinostoma caproni TaxID=27848 RepID=A0A183AKA7_9TREM|nr:unnamed protein product [Echinostoma caproni]
MDIHTIAQSVQSILDPQVDNARRSQCFKSSSIQSITLCREAVLMLSGFLDTCRTDVLTQWKPRYESDSTAADGTSFVQLLTRLLGHESIRIDALSLLTILLNRKPQSTSGSSEESFKLIEIMLRNDDIINRLASIVIALISEPPVYTESRYNSLVLFAEVFHRLGGGLITYWSEMEPFANPCACSSQRQFICPNRATHLLDTIVQLTTYPIRNGGPTGTTPHSGWSRAIFETDDWGAFFSQSVLDWDALELFLEQILPTMNKACQREDCLIQFESALINWARLFLQTLSAVNDPNVRGKVLMCISVVMQQLDSKYDTEFLIPFLNNIFASFRYVAPAEGNPNPFYRPNCVKAMQLLAATAFFRFVKTVPERVMRHFQEVATEVATLWSESVSGVVEKSVLLESLISLCVQSDLLKQLLSGALAQWTPNSPDLSEPMGSLLRSCSTGGPGLITALGLDQPVQCLNDFSSLPVQTRVTLTRNVLTLMAAVRRLSDPVRIEQLEQITVPLLEPVTPSVLMLLRSLLICVPIELYMAIVLGQVSDHQVFKRSDEAKVENCQNILPSYMLTPQ